MPRGKIKILEQIVLCPSKKEDIQVKLKEKKAYKRKKTKKKEDKSIKCQICEKSFINELVYKEHESFHENTFFECSEKDCFKKFKRKSSLRKHSYLHKGKFKYSCPDCKEKFIDKCKYQSHLASKHNKVERTYSCKDCPKVFTSADYLRKHKIAHSDEFKYICKICNQKFKWFTSLQTHQATHTQNKKVLHCKDCLKKFFNQRALERHSRIHLNLKYQCKICTIIVSNRKDNIMRHIRHLHPETSKDEIASNILTLENEKESSKSIESSIEKIEINVDDDDDEDDDEESNDLIIDESVEHDDQEKEPPPSVETHSPIIINDCADEIQSQIEIISPIIINNRVNVIQSIGNPNKNLHTFTNKAIETPVEKQKSEIKLQLPPKKKYNPIEHYRKILGLSETTNSDSITKENDEEVETVFPDHWRKRTSQNFLFRR